jgi:hypothetical protein
MLPALRRQDPTVDRSAPGKLLSTYSIESKCVRCTGSRTGPMSAAVSQWAFRFSFVSDAGPAINIHGRRHIRPFSLDPSLISLSLLAWRLARLPALATWSRRSSVLPMSHSNSRLILLYLLRAQLVGAYPKRDSLESRCLSVLSTVRYAADGQCQCACGRHRVIHKIGPVRERTMIGCFLQAARPAYHTSGRLFSMHVMARDSGNSRTTCHGHFLLHTARKQHEWSSKREPRSSKGRGRARSEPT